MPPWWTRLFRENPAPAVRQRLVCPRQPAVTYAIGDVHGCLDQLEALETAIATDAASVEGDKVIVMLGDYIDRGPKSAQTLDWLIGPPPRGFRRICLLGNHEGLMQVALRDPERCDDWLNWGGLETLDSYGIEFGRFVAEPNRRRAMLHASIPPEHRQFLETLPVMLQTPTAIFAHAGVRPGIALADQHDSDLVWIREPFLSTPSGLNVPVIHGHTPTGTPEILPWRIGIDTAAFSTGVLTAARVDAAGNVTFLSTGGRTEDAANL